MKTKVVTVIFQLMLCATVIPGSKYNQNELEMSKKDFSIDVSDFSVYYDVHTNETIRKMMPRPWYRPGWRLRLPFTGGPCECKTSNVHVVLASELQPSGLTDEVSCAILKFEPENATINLEVKMSNNSVLVQMFSASNPPPFCVPIPVPYLPPGLVDMCIRLFDVSIVQQRLHICLDMDTRIDMAPVLILHFDCMDMGFNGVSFSKPGGSGSNPANAVTDGDITDSNEPTQINGDVYDPVTEDPNFETTSQSMFKNSVKYI